jgi:hypothetical protein
MKRRDRPTLFEPDEITEAREEGRKEGYVQGRRDEREGRPERPESASRPSSRFASNRAAPVTHAEAAQACLDCGGDLTSWERDFLVGVLGFIALSPKQRLSLKHLCLRSGVRWPSRPR